MKTVDNAGGRGLNVIALIALVACFAAGAALRHFWPEPVNKQQSLVTPAAGTNTQVNSEALNSPPSTQSAGSRISPKGAEFNHAQGRELAQRYCVSCHLVPDPKLLTRSQWVHQIMPQMAVWFGVEPVNYGSMKDGKLLEAAGLFPEKPLLSEEEWFAIWDYYRNAAPSEPEGAKASFKARDGLSLFRARKLNFHDGAPMISLVEIESGQLHVGDGYAGVFATLDATGLVQHKMRVGPGPVGMVAQADGAYVVLIGRMFPSDVPEGAVVFVAKGSPEPQPVLANLSRPTHLTVADLNADGRKDLIVCSFGHRLGRFSWFEALGDGQYREQVLIEGPGALRSEVHDFNRDGRPDIILQVAQAREAIHLLFNQGDGRFESHTVIEQHPLFGYAYFQLVDFNQDGWMDILTVNGDNGDNPAPNKAYHGIRLYLNDGNNEFEESWFYQWEGAYKAMPGDFDGDGDLDLVAISYYPDWTKQGSATAIYLENVGLGRFEAYALPESAAGRWMTMDVGDLDGDGDEDVVLGSYSRGPVTIPVPAAIEQIWMGNGAAVLVLENIGIGQ